MEEKQKVSSSQKMEFIGQLMSGDFDENTMTFKIEGDMALQAGKYKILQTEIGNNPAKEIDNNAITDIEYWEIRCKLAEECLRQYPCDPDITGSQILAHNNYNQFLNKYGNK